MADKCHIWILCRKDRELDAAIQAGIGRLIFIKRGSPRYIPGSMTRCSYSNRPISSKDIAKLPNAKNAIEYIEDIEKSEEEHGR